MRPLSRARSKHSHAEQSRPGPWLATELLLLALATALAAALHRVLPGSWSTWDAAPPQWVILTVAVGGLVLLLTPSIASAYRLGHAGAGLEGAANSTAPADEDAAAVAPELAQLRALQAHVRCLEEALELETHRVTELRALLDTGHGEAVGEGMRRVRSTVRGLARRTEGDAVATEVLARVEAALDRLSTAHAFARPVLTRAGATTTGSAPSPGQLLMHGHHPDPGPPAATAEVPGELLPSGVADVGVEGLESHHADERHPGAGAPEREVVLPVPPREDPEAGLGQRGRRWFRRHAA